jgi:hypothetical protein
VEERPQRRIDRNTYAAMACDTLNYFTDTTFSDGRGDSLTVKFTFFCEYTTDTVPRVLSKDFCRFDVQPDYVENFGLKIQAFRGRNRSLLFTRILTKEQLSGVIDRRIIRYNVLSDARLFAFLPDTKRFILTVSLAQVPGGTTWFSQVYLVLDLAGELIQQGLVDYPHHCDGFLQLSPNKNYLLTCHELARLGGKTHVFKDRKVAFTRFLTDSLYAVVYDYYRDSLSCDTTIYWKQDTIRFTNAIPRADTSRSNAFLLTYNQDTVAQFVFTGYTDIGEGYYAEFEHHRHLRVFAFFEPRKGVLRVFDYRAALRQTVYRLKALKRLPARNPYRDYLQFYTRDEANDLCTVRFFLSPSLKVMGYRYNYN